jgi:hypothetical protein
LGEIILVTAGGWFSISDASEYDPATGTYLYRPSEATLAADPFLFIDPSYEFASYFGVFQAPGPNDNGQWMEVTRAWIPEPGTGLLLATGLLGLAAQRRRSA